MLALCYRGTPGLPQLITALLLNIKDKYQPTQKPMNLHALVLGPQSLKKAVRYG